MPRRRTKWRYVDVGEDSPDYTRCVRLNPAARKMWPRWPEQHNKYQVFRKCLYRKDGTCRRCGGTRTQVKELLSLSGAGSR